MRSVLVTPRLRWSLFRGLTFIPKGQSFQTAHRMRKAFRLAQIRDALSQTQDARGMGRIDIEYMASGASIVVDVQEDQRGLLRALVEKPAEQKARDGIVEMDADIRMDLAELLELVDDAKEDDRPDGPTSDRVENWLPKVVSPSEEPPAP